MRLRRRDLVLLAVAAACVVYYAAGAGGGFPLDDSWIHQTYGRNLALTGVWAFVPGQPSAASTSPLYTLLLAAGYRLGLPYIIWTNGLGVVALALTGMIAARLAERVIPGRRWIGAAAGLAVILEWHLIWAAASGMETMLFGLWTLALIALVWREADSRRAASIRVGGRGLLFGIVAGLATLTRPEAILLAGLCGLALLIVSPRRAVIWGVGAALGFAAVTAPYAAYNLRLTGGLLPDTAAAKQAEYAPLLVQPYLARLLAMVTPLAAGSALLFVPGAVAFVVGALRRPCREAVFALLLIVWPLALIALYAARLPAAYQHGRYGMPALPAYLVCGVIGTAWLLDGARRSLLPRVLARSLALAIVMILIGSAGVIGHGAYRQDAAIINEEMVASAQWIAAHIPPSDLLAVHDIGAVGYFAPRPLVDLAGLVSPEVVPILHDGPALWALLRQRGARYLLAFPGQIPDQHSGAPRLCPLFTPGGATSRSLAEPGMTVYRLNWENDCS